MTPDAIKSFEHCEVDQALNSIQNQTNVLESFIKNGHIPTAEKKELWRNPVHFQNLMDNIKTCIQYISRYIGLIKDKGPTNEQLLEWKVHQIKETKWIKGQKNPVEFRPMIVTASITYDLTEEAFRYTQSAIHFITLMFRQYHKVNELSKIESHGRKYSITKLLKYVFFFTTERVKTHLKLHIELTKPSHKVINRGASLIWQLILISQTNTQISFCLNQAMEIHVSELPSVLDSWTSCLLRIYEAYGSHAGPQEKRVLLQNEINNQTLSMAYQISCNIYYLVQTRGVRHNSEPDFEYLLKIVDSESPVNATNSMIEIARIKAVDVIELSIDPKKRITK